MTQTDPLPAEESATHNQTPKLEVKNLYKIFGDTPNQAFKLIEQNKSKDDIFAEIGNTLAVSDVNLQIFSGEIFVIMGLSGSGKSTLVRLLNRLIEPTKGQVLIDGDDVLTMNAEQLRQTRRNKISMVFQSFALMPHLTTLQNAAFGLDLAGEPEDSKNKKALNALAQVGLDAYADSYPDELSGGMRQRVGLARALANDPDILLMDEAFSALDPLIRTEMQDELVKLQAEQQRTIVFISHDLDEAMRIGDRIAIMEGGVVVQVGTPDDILRNPANDYVRSFFKEVDVSQVYSAGDIAQKKQVTIINKETTNNEGRIRSALKRLNDNDRDYGFLLDTNKTFLGMVSANSLQKADEAKQSINHAVWADYDAVHTDTPIRELYDRVAQSPCPVPVVNDHNQYIGSVSYITLLETLSRN